MIYLLNEEGKWSSIKEGCKLRPEAATRSDTLDLFGQRKLI